LNDPPCVPTALSNPINSLIITVGCPAGAICGYLTFAESTTAGAGPNGVRVEARTLAGKLVGVSTTGSDGVGGNGYYNLGSIPGQVIVTPIVPRTQGVIPQQTKKVFVNGDQPNFMIRGNPATVRFQAAPNSIVLLTTAAYTSSRAPSSKAPVYAYSGVTDNSGFLTLKITGGQSYHLTCWVASIPSAGSHGGNKITYSRRPSPNSQTQGTTLPDPLLDTLLGAQAVPGHDYTQGNSTSTTVSCPE
jgi:hypothetical protein